MRLFYALVSGFIFGCGLILSGMTNPAKVVAFLDVTGAWDPSLALVMGGAMGVAGLAFAFARGRRASLTGAPLQIPQSRKIESRLVFGSLMFGVGWGLGGLCPGPALVALVDGPSGVPIFVAAMLVGMGVHEYFLRAPA